MSEREKRKLSRKELDKLEAEMIKRPFERREFAGDPNQPRRSRLGLQHGRVPGAKSLYLRFHRLIKVAA